jgi:hypothetical protein
MCPVDEYVSKHYIFKSDVVCMYKKPGIPPFVN